MRLACWAVVLVIGLGANLARADRDPPSLVRFHAFGSLEGLHNLVVVSIAQDASGYLWVATDDGLYRWDGGQFDHFALEHGLPSTEVLAVGANPEGNLCAGTIAGLACWNGSQFVRATGLPDGPIATLATASDHLWVGTEHGLYERAANGGFECAPGWTGTAPVKALWADPRGVVAADGGRVWERAGDGAWRELADLGLAGDRVDAVFRARDGALWIRTAFHTWRLAAGGAHVEDVSVGLPSGYDNIGAGRSIIDGPDGEVWFATDRGIAQRTGDHWRVLDHSRGLASAGVRTMFVDREGTVWVGALGLFELRGRGLIERHDLASGLPGDISWGFARDRDGNLWTGTNRCLAHAVDGAWVCLPGSEHRVVRSFVFAPQGGVFLGGAPSDLVYIAPSGAATSISLPLVPAAAHIILALALGPEGDLWIATKVGLYKLPHAVPGPVERVEIPGVPADTRFSSLLVRDGRLWSATPAGVVEYERGAWRVFDLRHGFRSTAMRYLVPSHEHRLCVAYMEAIGLTCFETDGTRIDKLEHIDAAAGLASDKVYTLGEDRAGRLWVGTGDGLDVVTPGGVDHFAESDGLAGDDSAGNSFFADGDGSVWIGANGGASHIQAARYTGPPVPPHVLLRGGRLGERAIQGAEPLETPHDRDTLVVAFGGDTLTDAARVEYQAHLLPREQAWHTSRPPEIRYPGLLPGRYTLELRARIDRGAWGPTTVLSFVVRPAWWQTGWFLASVGLAALASLGAGFAWRQRAVVARRERELNQESVANLRALLDVVPDLISVYRDSKLVYLNHAARRLWGDELPDFDELTHPDDRARRTEMFTRARDAATSETYEIRIRDREGTYRSCEVSCARLELAGATSVVVSGRDVTERNRLRSHVLVSDRMASLGTLAAGIGHEINNPLAYVIGNLELIGEMVGGNASRELAGALHDANDGAERVRKIVAGLRSFSRSKDENRASLDVTELLRVSARLTANEVRHRAQLVWELGEVPRVVADDGRLTQVFLNLIVNAAHAIPEGRSDANQITIRTRTDARGQAVVEIVDTGRGMAPEVAARAFDPFFTTKLVGEGTGLGLAICHGIVASFDGQITIDSAPERGTTVRVVLPGAPVDEPAAPAAQPAVPVIEARHRVMVVDDDPMVGAMIARTLSREHDVVVADCGEAALAHIRGGAWFDVVISDVMMPNMTGVELLEELVRSAPEQARRLIFLSGGVFAPETRARLDQLGTVQLEKPVDRRSLRAAIANVIAARSAR